MGTCSSVRSDVPPLTEGMMKKRQIRCGMCPGGLLAPGGRCSGCCEPLLIPPAEVVAGKVGPAQQSYDPPVYLGVPTRLPTLRQAEAARSMLRGELCFFTIAGMGCMVTTPAAALIDRDGSGEPFFAVNPLSPVVMEVVRLFSRDSKMVEAVRESLVWLAGWPSSDNGMPYRMNVLTHGPQRYFRSVFQGAEGLKRLKTRKGSAFCLEGGLFRMEGLLARDEAVSKELAGLLRPPPPVPAPQVSSKGLYMWSPTLLHCLIDPGRTLSDFAAVDRLVSLSFFFKVPLVDRTASLHGASCLKLAVLDPVPDVREGDVDLSLPDLLEQRALGIASKAWDQGRRVGVLWSGGIDSTSVLVAFFKALALEERACPVDPATGVARSQLVVLLSKAAVAEYPLFFRDHLEHHRLRGVLEYSWIDETLPVSLQLRKLGPPEGWVFVTGECGDQLFGSDVMANCFEVKQLAEKLSYSAPPNPSPRAGFMRHFAKGLDAPWEETLLEALVESGLESDRESFKAWIAPLFSRSPVPIRSTFDALWWLNMTCKWQHVVLRIFNYCDSLSEADLNDGVAHFFRTEEFQRWSFTHHDEKLPDRKDWSSYKRPLKAYILQYTGDREYFENKLKCGSLGYVMHPPSEGDCVAVDADLNIIAFGASSIVPELFRRRYGDAPRQNFLA